MVQFFFVFLDDPSRAVHAAISICNELRSAIPDLSVGITTGRVFCGSLGSRLRHEYAIVGDIGMFLLLVGIVTLTTLLICFEINLSQ